MPEEPEHVLEHHRVAAARWIEEAGAEEVVGEQHGDRAREHRHHRDQQISGDQPGPDEQRHLQQVHARGPHVHDGDDDVDRAHDGGDAQQVHAENQHGHGIAGLKDQRRIHGPAAGRRTAGHEERATAAA